MEKETDRRGSYAWLITLIIGIPLSFLLVGHFFERAFSASPIDWKLVAEGLLAACIPGVPVIIASLILWFKRYSKLPSLAFVVTLITGGFFLVFSTAEAISGLLSEDGEVELVGGLLQILVFALPLLVAAWYLWAWPKVGSALLVLFGIGMGIWMFFGWNRPESLDELIIPGLLVGLPIFLGAFTFIREFAGRNSKQNVGSTG